MSHNKVVLAFSGGLDTSFCVKYLSLERGLEVHTATVNTGGFSRAELAEIEARAHQLGVASHTTLDETQNFYQHCLRYLVFGNVLKNNTYPLSVSAERVFQAQAIAAYARTLGATYVAHGSTGAGNDQVRFDLMFNILVPEAEVITPIRELKLSRQAEIDYLKAQGVDQDWTKARYSINKGLWGTTIGGVETLTSDGYLPEEAWPSQMTACEATEITLGFEYGELKSLNGVHTHNPVLAIQELAALAAPYAIGRDIHVGDTIIGIKGRVAFEAAAPLILIKAHHLLEKHTLTEWQLSWKEQLGNWYGSMLHKGQFLEPVMRNIEGFMLDTQATVHGTVRLRLEPYRFTLLGVQSSYDLMNPVFGHYGEMNNTWSGEDVKGFAKIAGNQTAIWHAIQQSVQADA